MKKLYSIAVFILLFANANAQTANWQWDFTTEGNGMDESTGIATDANGNAYIAGYFGSDSTTFGTTTLQNFGFDDIFITKFDALGNVLWAKQAGKGGVDICQGIACDSSGNAYITGRFESYIINFGQFALTRVGLDDIFIAKYDPSGNVLWAKSAGGFNSEYGTSIAADQNGNVYIFGFFYSDSVTFDNTTIYNSGPFSSDLFLAKYDGSGNLVWVHSLGGQTSETSRAISLDPLGNVYITGHFYSPTLAIGSDTLINIGDDDIFLAKYDPSGNPVWATSAGGQGIDYPISISVDPGGHAYITGAFESDSITFGSSTHVNAGDNDIFIAKYSASGNVLWSKSYGGNSWDIGWSIAVDNTSGVYLSGMFGSASINIGTTSLVNAGPVFTLDVFVTKLDASGNEIWALSEGGFYDDMIYDIASESNQSLFVTGSFLSPVVSFATTFYNNSGTENVFVAHLVSTTGLSENGTGNAGWIYPNPFTTSAQISLDKEVTNGDLELYNIHGQLVRKISNLSGQTININREDLPSGMYHLRLTEKNRELVTGGFVILD